MKYKNKLNMLVVAVEIERQQQIHLIAYFNGQLLFYRKRSKNTQPTLTNTIFY
nr:hypothetical protein [Proteus vulgaris]